MNRKNTKRPQAVRRVTKKTALKKTVSLSWQKVMLPMLLILPVVAAIAVYQWIQNPENLTITSVSVSGDLRVLKKEQLHSIIENYSKTNLFLLDEKSLEQKLEENPWIHSAAMTHVWPDKLAITIFEQRPVAFWGDDAMLAENGEIINAVLEDQKGLLPVLYSPEDKGRNMATGFLKIREIMKDFPVKLAEFKEDARGSWKIKLKNGMKLKIGREHQEKRLKRFMVAYKQSLKDVIEKVSAIDLRYTNGLAVKWKKGLSAETVF